MVEGKKLPSHGKCFHRSMEMQDGLYLIDKCFHRLSLQLDWTQNLN